LPAEIQVRAGDELLAAARAHAIMIRSPYNVNQNYLDKGRSDFRRTEKAGPAPGAPASSGSDAVGD